MIKYKPYSLNDIFSWETYERLPKSGNTDVFFFSNPFQCKLYTAWHTPLESVYPHSYRYRLLRAVCENDINEVKTICDKGTLDINSVVDSKYGLNALGLAAFLNRVAIIEYLLLRGADIDMQDQSGETPLMRALAQWNFDSVKFLVEKGADMRKKNRYGLDVFEKARMRGLNSFLLFFKREDENRKKNGAQPHFPKFTINFAFEKLFKDQTEDLILKKKRYLNRPLVYPFNDLKGNYQISSVNHENFV